MNTSAFATRAPADKTTSPIAGSPRRVAHRTRGHGGLTRLMSPSDLGQQLKPFVFLDHFDDTAMRPGAMPLHPHSGIATLTYVMEGAITYEDTTGRSGELPTGGVEWMMAGGGVWHTGGPAAAGRIRGFQLWVAMPPELENAPAQSQYLASKELPVVGPAHVLLGEYGGKHSPIGHPAPVTYLGVRLRAGEHWRYEPPAQHTAAWLALSRGSLRLADGLTESRVGAGEMVTFDESGHAIDIRAEEDTEFVLGSAVPHPHELVLGYYSVHTSSTALRQGEAGIRTIGNWLGERQRASF